MVSKRAGLAVAYKPPLTRKNVFEAAPGIEPGYRALQYHWGPEEVPGQSPFLAHQGAKWERPGSGMGVVEGLSWSLWRGVPRADRAADPAVT